MITAFLIFLVNRREAFVVYKLVCFLMAAIANDMSGEYNHLPLQSTLLQMCFYLFIGLGIFIKKKKPSKELPESNSSEAEASLVTV